MAFPNHSKAFTADIDIPPYTIVKAGSADGFVTVAAAATDPILGVSENVQVAATNVADVIQGGPGLVQSGGVIAAGDFLTSDASGHAIKAVPGAGAVANTIGKALVSAIAGDIIPFETNLGQVHG